MSVPRAPVMRPGVTVGRRGLMTAEGLRVRVANGSLRVDRTGGGHELARAGEVTAAYLLDVRQTRRLLRVGTHGEGLLLVAGPRPVLALLLMDWYPPPSTVEADLGPTLCGAVALAGALGLSLEPPPTDVLAGLRSRDVRAVQIRPWPPLPLPHRKAWALAQLAACAGLLAIGHRGDPAAAVLTVLSLLLAAVVVLASARGRAQARSVVLPPGTGTYLPARPAGPVPRKLHNSHLWLAAEEIRLVQGDVTLWLPGPSEGGVTQAVVEATHIFLMDDQGRDYVNLEAPLWCGDHPARRRLVSTLRDAGLTVVEPPTDRMSWHDGVDIAIERELPDHSLRGDERCDPSDRTPHIGGVASSSAALGALATVSWNVVPGMLLLLAALGLLTVIARDTVLHRRADRSAVQLAPMSEVAG